MNFYYKFIWYKEIWNTIAHILVGAVVAHTFLPYLPLWLIVSILFVLGAGREIWQNRRGKIQPLWISTVDAVSFPVGGALWWWVITTYHINIDLL